MTGSKKARRVLCNDDGWIMTESVAPITVRELKERMIDTYADTPVGALCWCVGGIGLYNYETKVGEMFGEGLDSFETDTDRRSYENTRHLIEEAGGPLTALTKLCHEAGMDIFPSVRMNPHGRGDPSSPRYGRFRREHPEYLIGKPGVAYTEGSLAWGIRTGFNYAREEVRQHLAKIITELFERFDTDGVELDFMRHPAFFRLDEAYANRYLMTDLLRYVRQRMDDVITASGRDIELAVRVPSNLATAQRIGLDVAVWIAEGLVDIVVAGGGFVPFEANVREFVEAAEGTDCLIYGGVEHVKPTVDEDVIRALASRFWHAGASGMYFFNYFGKPAEWKRRIYSQVADPEKLRRLNKSYHVDYMHRVAARDFAELRDQHNYSTQDAVPPAQLPVTLPYTLTAPGPVLRLEMADDLDAAIAEGAPAHCVLRLMLENFKGEDDLEVRLNQQVLPSARESFGGFSRLEWMDYGPRLDEVHYAGGVMEFDIASPPLRQGVNELEVRMIKRTVQQPEPVVLQDVELAITYDNE